MGTNLSFKKDVSTGGRPALRNTKEAVTSKKLVEARDNCTNEEKEKVVNLFIFQFEGRDARIREELHPRGGKGETDVKRRREVVADR